MTLVLKFLIELVGSFTILIVSNLTGQPAGLEETQLIECIANHRTSIQSSNYLLEFRNNGIKLSLLQKCSTTFSWIELA